MKARVQNNRGGTRIIYVLRIGITHCDFCTGSRFEYTAVLCNTRRCAGLNIAHEDTGGIVRLGEHNLFQVAVRYGEFNLYGIRAEWVEVLVGVSHANEQGITTCQAIAYRQRYRTGQSDVATIKTDRISLGHQTCTIKTLTLSRVFSISCGGSAKNFNIAGRRGDG